MTSRTGSPAILDHDLNPYFPELLKFDSTAEMEASDLYTKIKPEVERIMNSVVVEHLSEPPAVAGGLIQSSETSNSLEIKLQPPATAGGSDIRALAWNLERGIRFDGILDALKNNDELKSKDVLLLAELDHGMARSGNRFVAREIACELKLNYAFAPVYIPLQKGSGVESEMEGENTGSIHGLAMMSPWPMKNVHAVPLPNGKDKMWGKEKRLGWLRALIADIEHPAGTFRAVTVHLDVHCSREHRRRQVRIILDHLNTLSPMPTLIGGDWNTTTFNAQTATHAILGYWRRVMMGIKNVAKNHFPHPDRYFERGLFGDLESRGYEYKNLNESGVGTLHYHIESIEKNTNLRDWVPEWCFKFIFWAAGRVGGSVSVRLDWFVGKGLRLAPETKPKTIANLVDSDGLPLSDHDAITVDFVLVART
ncbi:MAG: endonuclease/exonuclease/phosphatase family protein [Chloracidobacterium sp.]|nr:endonuclease/exonuclease/phosphatase family protein [Chloracidobacterium sp.]